MGRNYDTLGRRKPTFDRKTSGQKANQTKFERYGEDHFSEIGKIGGKLKTRGYLGMLKDEGRDEELKELVYKGLRVRHAKVKK